MKHQKVAKEKVTNSSKVVLDVLVDVVGDLHTQVEVVDEEKVIYRGEKIYYEISVGNKDYESLKLNTEVVGKVYNTEMVSKIKLHRQPDGCGGEM